MSKAIEKLTYLNERGESLTFSTKSLYHVNFKDVTGLSDIRNEIFAISGMGQNGDTYIGNRIESRDIEVVGNIKERDRQIVQRVRRTLSHILNPEYKAVLIYEYGDIKRVIDCTVNNAPVITRGVIYYQFTIQLTCLNPFWREESETRNDLASWIGAFEFPVPDGLEIDDAEGWEIGYREPSLIVNVYNSGDVRSGLRVVFRAIGIMSNPTILNVETGEFIKMNINMVAGDILTINTGYGQKAVTLTRGSITTDAFRYLDIDSTYIQLAVGDNLFRYDAAAELENLEVSIYHNNLFLGV